MKNITFEDFYGGRIVVISAFLHAECYRIVYDVDDPIVIDQVGHRHTY